MRQLSPEFELIARFFTRGAGEAVAGIGDDCALISAGPDSLYALTTDTLNVGVHFFPDVSPQALGHKSLAVNLSDLAAAGATPRYALLALTLPARDDAWLDAFARGLFALADAHGVAVIGGDTTRGPLSINITAIGEVPRQHARGRDGARSSDDVWVSGELGAAMFALDRRLAGDDWDAAALAPARERLERPQPRVALGVALRGIASACVDVSDGFLADLGHILERSNVGARIQADALPRAAVLRDMPDALRYAATGGDEYELVFTARPERRDEIARLSRALALPLTRVGEIVAGETLMLQDGSGQPVTFASAGFDHFAP